MKITITVEDYIGDVKFEASRELEFICLKGDHKFLRRKEYLGRALNECEQELDATLKRNREIIANAKP